jgi:hypothetical protein
METGGTMKTRGFRSHRKLILLCLLAVLVASVVVPTIAWATVNYGSSQTSTSTTTTITLARPSGTAAGNLLLVQIGRNGGSNGSVTVPTGWNLVNDTNRSTDVGQTILYKVATGSEPANYSFTVSYGVSGQRASGVIARYTGVDTSVNPIAAVSANTGNGSTMTATSVNGYAGSMIVACYAVDNEQNTFPVSYPTTPTGMTSRGRASQNNGPTVRLVDQSISATGATGNKVSTANPSDYWVATLVSLTSKVELTASASGVDKVYDGTTDATVNLSSADIAPGDDVTLSYTSAAFADENAAGGIDVDVSGISISGSDAYKYDLQSDTTTTTASITPAELTVDGAVAQDKVYDGTTDAVVDFSGASLVGVIDDDEVSLDASGATAAFADKNVGDDIAVAIDGLALTGEDAGNYTVTAPDDLTASITPAELTVDGAVAQDKVYDGTTDAVVDFSGASLVGVIDDDEVSLDASGATAAFADKNVGDDIAVAIDGLALTGEDAGNYTVTAPDDLTASITPAELTVDGAVAQDKVYDGMIDAVVDFSGASLVGVIDDDEVSLDASGATAAFADKNVGDDIAVAIDGLALTGEDAGNYTVTAPDDLTASITPAELAVDATGVDKVYDGTTDAEVTLDSGDLVAGDDVTFDYTSASFADEDVADGIDVAVTGISLGGGDASNYELQNTEAATAADITPAELTITAKNQTKVYKKAFTFSGTEITVSGLIDGEVTSATLTSSGAAAAAAPGTYPIVPSAAVGTGLDNYDITYANGTMTVTGGWRVAPFHKPLRKTDTHRFQRGTIIPVAFKVRDYYGAAIKTAKPKLRLYSNGTKVRGPVTVKYNSVKRLYIYQLKTATLKLVPYNVRISLGTGNGGRSVTIRIVP